jgi:hypothetical protein
MSKIAQTVHLLCRYRAQMDIGVWSSLEAIANLIYLIRHSLHDPLAAIAYVDLAEERLKAIAAIASAEVAVSA